MEPRHLQQLWVAYFHAVALLSRFRGSRRLVAEALRSMFGIPASASWVVKLQNQATTLLRSLYDELVAALPSQAVVNADETPYKQGALKK